MIKEEKFPQLNNILQLNKHFSQSTHAAEVNQWREAISMLTNHFRNQFERASGILRVCIANEAIEDEDKFQHVIETMLLFSSVGNVEKNGEAEPDNAVAGGSLSDLFEPKYSRYELVLDVGARFM